MSYIDKLKDPRWQKKRLEIPERDKWKCQGCFDHTRTLSVHHRIYIDGNDPWDYPNELLVTLCEDCHKSESEERYACERSLLEELKKYYFALDVSQMAEGIFDGKLKLIIDKYLKEED